MASRRSTVPWRSFVRPLDWVVLVLAVAAAVASASLGGAVDDGGVSEVVALSSGVEIARWNLSDIDAPRVHALPGPVGTTVVRVSREEIRVVEAPCPERWCMRDGGVTREGGVIVCAPNRLIIRDARGALSRDDAGSAVDAVTQ